LQQLQLAFLLTTTTGSEDVADIAGVCTAPTGALTARAGTSTVGAAGLHAVEANTNNATPTIKAPVFFMDAS
jgi:hypothetical protein